MRIAWHGFLLLACVAAHAQAGTQRRILALENAWNQAVQQKDARAIGPLMHDELVYIDYDGRVMNKAQYLTFVSAPALQIEHIVSESMQVQSYGQSAVVAGVYREKGIKNGKPYLRRERFIDTWIDQDGLWVCVASQSTLILH
ncbi:MAG: nuclear transport factor 2 family protein [Candidatus Sulfotelmatobacter sp.]